MSWDTNWQALIRHYADGRQPCNCGDAYYDAQGRCAYGCQANQHDAREDIAGRVFDSLGIPRPAPTGPENTRRIEDVMRFVNAMLEARKSWQTPT